MVGHHVVGSADGIGALEKADGFYANGHILRARMEGADKKASEEKAKWAEEREHWSLPASATSVL
jgi:hypothetical protein